MDHQAKKMYSGRASYDFHAGNSQTGFQADGFRVIVDGHVIAECEDSECADFICQAWNADHEAHVAKLKEALRKYVGVRDGFGKISANLALGLPCDHDFYCHNPDDQDNGCLHDTEGRMKHPCKHCGKTRAALNREARNG